MIVADYVIWRRPLSYRRNRKSRENNTVIRKFTKDNVI